MSPARGAGEPAQPGPDEVAVDGNADAVGRPDPADRRAVDEGGEVAGR